MDIYSNLFTFYFCLVQLIAVVQNVQFSNDNVCRIFKKKSINLVSETDARSNKSGVIILNVDGAMKCDVYLEPGGIFEISVVDFQSSQKQTNATTRIVITDEIVERRSSDRRHCAYDGLRRLNYLPSCRKTMTKLRIEAGRSYDKVLYQSPYVTKLAKLSFRGGLSFRLMLQRVERETEIRYFETSIDYAVVNCSHPNPNLTPILLYLPGSKFMFNGTYSIESGNISTNVFQYLIIDPVNGEKCICHYGAKAFPILGRAVVFSIAKALFVFPWLYFYLSLGLVAALLLLLCLTAVWKSSGSRYKAVKTYPIYASPSKESLHIDKGLTLGRTEKRMSIRPYSFGPLRQGPAEEIPVKSSTSSFHSAFSKLPSEETCPPITSIIPSAPSEISKETKDSTRPFLTRSFSSIAMCDSDDADEESEVEIITRLINSRLKNNDDKCGDDNYDDDENLNNDKNNDKRLKSCINEFVIAFIDDEGGVDRLGEDAEMTEESQTDTEEEQMLNLQRRKEWTDSWRSRKDQRVSKRLLARQDSVDNDGLSDDYREERIKGGDSDLKCGKSDENSEESDRKSESEDKDSEEVNSEGIGFASHDESYATCRESAFESVVESGEEEEKEEEEEEVKACINDLLSFVEENDIPEVVDLCPTNKHNTIERVDGEKSEEEEEEGETQQQQQVETVEPKDETNEIETKSGQDTPTKEDGQTEVERMISRIMNGITEAKLEISRKESEDSKDNHEILKQDKEEIEVDEEMAKTQSEGERIEMEDKVDDGGNGDNDDDGDDISTASDDYYSEARQRMDFLTPWSQPKTSNQIRTSRSKSF